jgi:hypothetical protein
MSETDGRIHISGEYRNLLLFVCEVKFIHSMFGACFFIFLCVFTKYGKEVNVQ